MPVVLVVEDDEDILESLVAVLEREGYEAPAVRNGVDALEMLEKIPAPDLVVIDMFMPLMSGRELLLEIRQREALADTPVLVMSATSRMVLPSDVPVVYKPFSLSIFLGAVRRYARSGR